MNTSSSTTSLASSSSTTFLGDVELESIKKPSKSSSPPTSVYQPVDEEYAEDNDEEALLGSHTRMRENERHTGSSGEVWFQVGGIVAESAPTLLLTTLGLLFTGELLDHVSRWRAMQQVDQLIMIIPVILNLKGNLEMNLSARLSTAANVGELEKPKSRRGIILGNLALLQVQATVVSFVASGVSLILGLAIPRISAPALPSPILPPRSLFRRHSRRPPKPLNGGRKSGLKEIIMVASTAVTAACASSIILGSFMSMLVLLCWKLGRDPDNIAPPIAACLGDLVTLCLLGAVSSLLIMFIESPVPFVVVALVTGSAITCGVIVRRNPHVKHLMSQGWTPLFGAMIISSCTGIILDLFVSRYEGFALLAVVISGLPGSVGSIFVSRLSTALHASALSSHSSNQNQNQPSSRLVIITLLIVTLPVEIIFLATLRGLGWLHLPLLFVSISIVFFCCAVIASLLIAEALTKFLWSKDLDPDMYALPMHSAVMDLIGQLLLVLCFELGSRLGAPVKLRPQQ